MKTTTTVKKGFLLICFVLGSMQMYGQNFKAKNGLYVEVGGNAGLYSLNYDRVLYQKNAFKAVARAGISLVPQRFFDQLATMMPLEMIALLGRQKHHLEVGLGITPALIHVSHWVESSYKTKLEFGTVATGRLGYRYQKPEGGFLFRAGVGPMLNFDSRLVVFAGIGIGKSF